MMIEGYWNTRRVKLDGKFLSPKKSQKLRNHSPDGFAWGYAGSGPAQLALAILLEATHKELAQDLYQKFKFEFIAKLPQSDFAKEVDVRSWLESQISGNESMISPTSSTK